MKFGSKLEKNFANICDEANIEWVMQYKLKNKRYDFFFPKYKILVEIDGNYIHSNEAEGFRIDKPFKKKIFKNDAFKNIIAKSLGFKILRIWETELNNLTPKLLLEKIKNLN
jgi:very-short-patch-repair endonuclease